MDILDDEILDLWRLLHKHQVAYIMVGGFASVLNGFNRTTDDMDLWLKDTLENRKKLRAALKELEIGDFESLETTQLVPGYSTIMLNSGFDLDLMTSLKGFEQIKFDECYEISPLAVIEGVPVKFLHINKLIEAKKASGRPKDLLDLAALEKIRQDQNSSTGNASE